MRAHWSSTRSCLSPRGWGGYPSNTRLCPPLHVMRSHWWTVTSCLCLIGAESRASEHKRPHEGQCGYLFMDPESQKAKQEEAKKRRKEASKMQEERTKREVEEEGGSQDKKRKVLEQAPPNYWDWLPPELKEDIEKKAFCALIQECLDKGFQQIHDEMAELPRCHLHGTVS